MKVLTLSPTLDVFYMNLLLVKYVIFDSFDNCC